MAEAAYVLCAATSVLCAILLLRKFAATRARLLFWSSLGFGGLAANNLLLFVDLVVVPDIDLSISRTLVALVAMGVLVFGLIWETR
jgi:hypothetical protein